MADTRCDVINPRRCDVPKKKQKFFYRDHPLDSSWKQLREPAARRGFHAGTPQPRWICCSSSHRAAVGGFSDEKTLMLFAVGHPARPAGPFQTSGRSLEQHESPASCWWLWHRRSVALPEAELTGSTLFAFQHTVRSTWSRPRHTKRSVTSQNPSEAALCFKERPAIRAFSSGAGGELTPLIPPPSWSIIFQEMRKALGAVEWL